MIEDREDIASLPTVAEPKTRAGREIANLPFGNEVVAVAPRTLEEVFRYAQLVARTRLAPDSYDDDAEKISIGILAGAELGVPPMQALKGIAIINKRPAIWGDLAVALVQSKGVLKSLKSTYIGTKGEDDYTCTVVAVRYGHDEPYEGEFSIADAKRAGLWNNAKKDPWIKYPYRMLFNRARAFVLRDGFADCLAGLAIVEEARDIPEAPIPVDQTFLNDDPPAIEHKPAAMSEPLTRGFDILKRTAVADVADLRATILEELTDESERAQWEVACNLATEGTQQAAE